MQRSRGASQLGCSDLPAEVQSVDENKSSPWGIHWYSPALMVGLFLLGIASSIAHHLFYQSLHNTDVESSLSQEWAIRIGTGLAFITKASLAAAIGVAYTQRLWVTLRQKAITMQGVDDLFLMTVDPTAFFNWEVLKVAKLLFLMAASMWLVHLPPFTPHSFNGSVSPSLGAFHSLQQSLPQPFP